MAHVADDRERQRVSVARSQRIDEIKGDARATLADRRDRPATRERQKRKREAIRLPLAQRYALRDGIAYAVEAPEGEIGLVTAVQIAPFEYWPDMLIVEDTAGTRMRVPIDSVAAAVPSDGKLMLTRAPVDSRPIAPLREARPTKSWVWTLAAIASAVFGLGGYIATFVAVGLDTGVSWGPGLAAIGAGAGAAGAASWRKRGRTWAAAVGLGSFWLPLAAGAILSLVLIVR